MPGINGALVDPEVKKLFKAVLADNAALRAAFIALTAKIDASTVTGLATNYGTSTNPPAQTLTA